ncbi:hypothetical protein JI58_08385 [Marinosulfonomonas sp. PRT-SC04]|nr:hypothetical protein JI58_08385 [Marinosulfonomonas sp. PRT-SC04]
MSDKSKDYEVTETRFIGGLHRAVGDLVSMTEKAAKYYLPPYGTGLKVPGARKVKVGGLDDPNVKNPTQHATGKPGK